ncbi:unnamed protein product [Cuscuta campestris]|uniref:RNase H type-1 domain-containing protein n=1 Tax=Cuscuta campestris TaxID=132261 RepID=A0A484KLF8_9ASTE|nr:unnamed protein product [Cuscuta campestris]
MQRKINRGRVFTTRTNTPLAPEIFAEPYPHGFKVLFVKRYDGESDPQEHINSYVQVMIAVDASDVLMCQCFLQTVDSKVADWVNHIPAGSIQTWDESGLRFLEHFVGNSRPKKHFTHLASVRQKHGESLKNFIVRWRKESREVEGTDDKSRLAMFTAALKDGLLHTNLTTHPPDTFEEAMVRAGRYVTLEERKEEKKEKTPKEEEKVGNKKPFKNKKQGFPDGPKGTNPGTSEKHKSANPVFTLPVAEVMAHAARTAGTNDIPNLFPEGLHCGGHWEMKFVQDVDGGNPGNAQNRKRREGQVAQAEAREKRHIGLEDEEEDSEPAPHRQKRHHGCNYIIGGNIGGVSATSQKKWASAAMVYKVAAPAQPEGKKLKTEPIVFSNADLPETGVPHRDALVITIDIMDLLIHKTLVDTGSSVNIMYMDTYKTLGIVLITPESFRIYYAIRFQFRVSNNEAEYEALINGLKILGKLGVSRVQVYSDSRLVVGQISGEFEEKEERMKKYRDLSLEMLGKFEYKLEHIPRAYNAEADVLSKLSAESPEYISKLATVEELATPSLNMDEVLWVSADSPEWLDRLARYIEDEVAPEDSQEARLLRMRAPTYKVQEGVLYKRSYNVVLLRCLRAAEAKALMEEIHEGVENVNRTIISGIKKKLLSEGSKWVDELPRVLWTHRTTPRRATGDTSFGLAYEFEARTPAETVIPTRREMTYDPEVNKQN